MVLCDSHNPAKDAGHCVFEHFGSNGHCNPMGYTLAVAEIDLDEDWPTKDCADLTLMLCKAMHAANCDPCNDIIQQQLECNFMARNNLNCGRLLCFDHNDDGNINSTNSTTTNTSRSSSVDHGLSPGGKAGVAIFSILMILGFGGVITYMVSKRKKEGEKYKNKKINPFKTAYSRNVRNMRPQEQQLQHTIIFDDPHDAVDATTETPHPSPPTMMEEGEDLQGDVVDSSFQTVPIV